MSQALHTARRIELGSLPHAELCVGGLCCLPGGRREQCNAHCPIYKVPARMHCAAAGFMQGLRHVPARESEVPLLPRHCGQHRQCLQPRHRPELLFGECVPYVVWRRQLLSIHLYTSISGFGSAQLCAMTTFQACTSSHHRMHGESVECVILCSSQPTVLLCTAACLQPTCLDMDVTTDISESFECPAGSLPNVANELATPPTLQTCCMVGLHQSQRQICTHLVPATVYSIAQSLWLLLSHQTESRTATACILPLSTEPVCQSLKKQLNGGFAPCSALSMHKFSLQKQWTRTHAKETVYAVLTLTDQPQHMLHSARGNHAFVPVLQQSAFKCIRMQNSNQLALQRTYVVQTSMPCHLQQYVCMRLVTCSAQAAVGLSTAAAQCSWAALKLVRSCVLPCRPPAQTPTSHRRARSLGCALPAHSPTPPMQTLDQPATPCAAQ